MINETNRVAVIGIIISDSNSSGKINQILHEYREYIIGRMGLPYPKRHLNIISIAIDAPINTINQLNGKLGQLNGVSVQTAFAKL